MSLSVIGPSEHFQVVSVAMTLRLPSASSNSSYTRTAGETP